MIDTLVIPLLKIAIVLNATLVAVTYMVLLERKVIAWAQSRLGPMRVGPYGILQPVADAVKLMIKEDITPVRADRWVFTAAPIISMVPALIVYAVIPFGPTVTMFGHPVPLFIADINVGLLYIVSVASVGVYGIILAGWASNSKYPLLASLRASAQLISYEVTLGLSVIGVVMLAHSLNLEDIVAAQAGGGGFWTWFIVPQFPAFAGLCARLGHSIRVVSDGLDRMVEVVLRRHGLDLPYYANHLEWRGDDRWRLTFPNARSDCQSLSGTCKCNFIAEAPHLFFHELWFERIWHHDLKIGPASIDLQCHQRRVIERRFVDAP